ncbi:hypothetical protein EVAR_86619_1 [Eumeta japonica]|uniref:Uncharacterized protein n=1 Tax=Eumeta variegata TaxID=151549 RepID=A0A4C1W171_EUMVA|nr:hypothetical protein EVAR_86619_1 [Eumeta japonica]
METEHRAVTELVTKEKDTPSHQTTHGTRNRRSGPLRSRTRFWSRQFKQAASLDDDPRSGRPVWRQLIKTGQEHVGPCSLRGSVAVITKKCTTNEKNTLLHCLHVSRTE